MVRRKRHVVFVSSGAHNGLNGSTSTVNSTPPTVSAHQLLSDCPQPGCRHAGRELQHACAREPAASLLLNVRDRTQGETGTENPPHKGGRRSRSEGAGAAPYFFFFLRGLACVRGGRQLRDRPSIKASRIDSARYRQSGPNTLGSCRIVLCASYTAEQNSAQER